MRNPAGRAFSQRRLRGWLGANLIPGRPATEVRDLLTTELNRFRGGAAMTDDQAFLLLMEEGGSAPKPARSGSRVQFTRGSFLFPAPV
jgi:hypothetical protein